MLRIHILKGFSDLDGALWALKYCPGLRTRSEVVQVILESGQTVTDKSRFEILQLLGEWNLADHQRKSLTPTGEEFYFLWEMKHDTAIDVLHGLQYGLWTQHSPEQNLASWAYQQVCNYLWEYQALPNSQNLITYIYDNLDTLDTIHGDIANAFSAKSVNGAYDWLSPLKPPVFEGVRETTKGKNFRSATFTRRSHCSTALFLMGLDWVARETGNQYGDLWSIGSDQRQAVCRFCLIDESRFDFMFNETLRRFPDHLSVRRTGGLYIVIENEPRITDF